MAKKATKVKNLHVKCPKCRKKVKMQDMEVVEETTIMLGGADSAVRGR